MSSFIFPFITFPYVSRVLLPEGTGRVAFATSVISYFSLFANLGIPTYGIRICAQVRDNKEELSRTAHELLLINLITSLVTYIALAIAIAYVPQLHAEKTLLVVISTGILLGAIGMEWLFKALEQYTYITIRSILFKFLALIAMFFMVRTEKDYVQYGFITIFAASASNILNLMNAHKYISFRPVGKYHISRHLKPVCVFFALACASTIYTHLDVVMLGFMKTNVDVGYYNAAVKIKTILVSIVTSLGVVVLPRASYYVENGQIVEFWRICKKALNFVVLLATPLMVYFILFARDGILLLSGDKFEGSILPMQVIMPTLVMIGVTNILGIQILVPLGREKVVLYSEIAGALVDVIINAILIPRLSSTGAAIGTLAAEAVVLIVQCYYLKQDVIRLARGMNWKRILVATALATVVTVWVKCLITGHCVKLLLSAFLFFGFYGLFMLIRKEELVVEIWNQLKKIGRGNTTPVSEFNVYADPEAYQIMMDFVSQFFFLKGAATK